MFYLLLICMNNENLQKKYYIFTNFPITCKYNEIYSVKNDI